MPSYSSSTNTQSSTTGRVDGIDAFLTQIESKLRQPYSSLDLAKPSTGHFSSWTASSSGGASGGTSPTQNHMTPGEIIQNMDRCFSLMTQSIRLRCIIGLLGFEPNVSQLYNRDENFDVILEDFFKKISTDPDKDVVGGQTLEQRDLWIPVLAGIIQGKMFSKKGGGGGGSSSSSSSYQDANHVSGESGLDDSLDATDESLYRNRKTDAVLKKAVDVIMQSIMEASNDAVNFRNEAEVAMTKCLGDTTDESNMEKLLDSFHIGSDINPHYVPWCYRLCSEDVVREAIPELDDRCDFIMNASADILQVDERVDRIKAQEEKKEQEEKEKMKALAEERKRKMSAAANADVSSVPATTNVSVSNGMNANKVGGNRNGTATTSATASNNSTAELLMRSKVKLGASSNAGSSSTTTTTRPLGVPKTSSVVGGGRPRLSGLGRGAAANAISGRSLANPMSQMKRPLGAKSIVGMPGMRRGTAMAGDTSATASSNATAALSAAAKSRTKMKMIDVSEVEGLKKEEDERNKRLSEEEIRENKRRKIMEKAMAKGLKVKSMGNIKDTSSEHNNS